MRLLNTKTFELQYFVVPPENYAILSHTWREEELIFGEYSPDECRQYLDKDGSENARRRSYQKIRYLCDQASKRDIPLAWIDTICIDKSSSAELSEAINSMFQWYSKANVCYAYLDDVDVIEELEGSRWLTRGWTLQELIAPRFVEFYSKTWKLLGSKATLATKLSRCTHINVDVLRDREKIVSCRVATKFSWAAYRKTTRAEDQAYCLFGLFGINMPLLYGEGEHAFQRLQKELLRLCPDESILAWGIDGGLANFYQFHKASLAPGASMFRSMYNMVWPSPANRTITLTETGDIELDAKILVRRFRKPRQLLSLLSNRCPRVCHYLVLMCQDIYEPTAVATAFPITPYTDPQSKSKNVFTFQRHMPLSTGAAEFGKAYDATIQFQIPGPRIISYIPNTQRMKAGILCTIDIESTRLHGYSVRALKNSNNSAITMIHKDSIISPGGRSGIHPFQSLAFLHSSKKDAFVIDFFHCGTNGKACVIPYHAPLHEADLEAWLDTFDCACEPHEADLEAWKDFFYCTREAADSSWADRIYRRGLRLTLHLQQSVDCTREEVHCSHEAGTKVGDRLTLHLPRSLNNVSLKLRGAYKVWKLDIHVTEASKLEEIPDDWVLVDD